MSGDRTGETTASATLSEPTMAWLEARAAEQGVSRDELLRGLVAALRAVDEEGLAPATRDDVAALRETVRTLDEDTEERIQDVRQRVIQVKREADAKAPAEHDHPETRERVERAEREVAALAEEVSALREAADALRSDLGDVEATVADLEATLDGGFANYEEVLEYLTDESDRLADDFDALAEVLAGVRGELRSLANRVATAAGVEQLRDAANRHGVRTASCEECGGEVDVALLSRPACPHCAATFADVEPRRGFLGTHTLVVGEVPALSAGAGPATEVEPSTDRFDGLEPFDDV